MWYEVAKEENTVSLEKDGKLILFFKFVECLECFHISVWSNFLCVTCTATGYLFCAGKLATHNFFVLRFPHNE